MRNIYLLFQRVFIYCFFPTECHQAFFLFGGQCYSKCPDKTFASRSFFEKHIQPKPKETITKFDSIEALSSSLKRSTKAHDKFDMLHYVKKNPFYRNVMKPQPPKICLDCHYSCLTCSGPYNYQCVSCPDDARLVNLTKGSSKVEDSYCYPIQVLPQIQSASWLFRLYVIFAIILTLVLGVILYFILSCLLGKFGMGGCCRWGGKESGSVSYNRLSNSEHYSGQHKNADIVKEIHSAIYDGSDSDNSGSDE